jgi:hypothetical protein
MADAVRELIRRLVPRLAIDLPFLVAFCLAACGGGGGVTGPSLNVSGTYTGPQTFSTPPGLTTALTLTLTDVAGLVNGSFSQKGDFGSVTGTVSGSSLHVQSMSTLFGTTCTFNAGVSNDAATISGGFVCSNQDAGTFTVNRAS